MRISLFLIAVLWLRFAAAETVIVANVRGYALRSNEVQAFTRLVVIDGKVNRLLNDASAPVIPNATVIDGRGHTLLPGLIDAHGHVLELGRQRLQVDVRGSASVKEALARVRQFAEQHGAQRWIVGRGWNQVLWPDKQFPTATQLDSAVFDRPALLTRVDGHAIWVNSVALNLAKISKATRDPPGGQILRDANGEPTGILVDAATDLIERHLPQPTAAELRRALVAAADELVSVGLTGVHDAGIDLRTYRAYRELARQGRLPLRVYAMLADGKHAREVIESGPKPSEFNDRLQMRAIKAWADGALGSRGAALLNDYADRPGYRGTMLYTEPKLRALAQLAGKYGWQLNVHAIGDAANRAVLDAFENGFTPEERIALRPRIEHAQIVAREDLPRFAKLNVIASMQPTHATSDMNMAEDRVGRQHIAGAYAWRTLKSSGARLAGGSDFPVEFANPFYGLHAAVTRKNRDGQPPNGWRAEEKLSREEALRLFTVDAAYAAHMEDRVGSLQPGQWADFILIDRDYFSVPESEIDDLQVLATYVAGKKVFER